MDLGAGGLTAGKHIHRRLEESRRGPTIVRSTRTRQDGPGARQAVSLPLWFDVGAGADVVLGGQHKLIVYHQLRLVVAHRTGAAGPPGCPSQSGSGLYAPNGLPVNHIQRQE